MKMVFLFLVCAIQVTQGLSAQGVLVFIEVKKVYSWDHMNSYGLVLYVPEENGFTCRDYVSLEEAICSDSVKSIPMLLDEGCMFLLNSRADSLGLKLVSLDSIKLEQTKYWESTQYFKEDKVQLSIEIYMAPNSLVYETSARDLSKCSNIHLIKSVMNPNILLRCLSDFKPEESYLILY